MTIWYGGISELVDPRLLVALQCAADFVEKTIAVLNMGKNLIHMDADIFTPAVRFVDKRMGMEIAIPNHSQRTAAHPNQVWACHYIGRVIRPLVTIGFNGVNGAKRTQKLEVLLISTFSVSASLIKCGYPAIFLAQIDADDLGKHVYAVEHDGCVVHEVDEVECATVLHLPEHLVVQIAYCVAYAMNANTDAIPSGNAPVLLLFKSLLNKRYLLGDMLVSVERSVELLDEIRVKVYLECLFATHCYTSISPDMSFGSRRSRASRAAATLFSKIDISLNIEATIEEYERCTPCRGITNFIFLRSVHLT